MFRSFLNGVCRGATAAGLRETARFYKIFLQRTRKAAELPDVGGLVGGRVSARVGGLVRAQAGE